MQGSGIILRVITVRYKPHYLFSGAGDCGVRTRPDCASLRLIAVVGERLRAQVRVYKGR
jgi:hypothetical protein